MKFTQFLAMVVLFSALSGCNLLDSKTENLTTYHPESAIELQATLTSQPTIKPKIVEEVKNGIYTNYKYGFRFKYNQDLFTNYSGKNYWDSKAGSTSPFDLGVDDAWMSLTIRDQEGVYYGEEEFFEELLKNGEYKGPKMNLTNVKVLERDDYVLITSEFSNSPEYVGERAFSYEARLRKSNIPIITLSISTLKKENLAKYKPAFEEIIESFEFVDTASDPFDKIEDGVYTNYTLGYKLKIPSDLVLLSDFPDKVWRVNAENPDDKDQEFATFSLRSNGSSRSLFETMKNSEEFEKVPIKQSLFSKEKEIENKNYQLLLVKAENNPETEMDWGDGLFALWKISDSSIVELSMSYSSESNDFIQKSQLFNEIVQSFELLN